MTLLKVLGGRRTSKVYIRQIVSFVRHGSSVQHESFARHESVTRRQASSLRRFFRRGKFWLKSLKEDQ